MNRAIVLSISLLLHLFSHSPNAEPSNRHSFPTPQPGCSSPSSPICSRFQSGKASGSLLHILSLPRSPYYHHTELRFGHRHIQFHIFTITLKTKPDEFYGHPLQRNQNPLFGSQGSTATFCPRYLTISQNQNRKYFFWNSTLGWRPMLFFQFTSDRH